MESTKRKLDWKSLRFRLTLTSFVVCLPVLAFLFFSNLYTLSRLRVQTVDITRNSLAIYQEAVDTQLNNYSTYLIDFFSNSIDLVNISRVEEEDPSLLLRLRLETRFAQSLGNYPNLFGFFAFDLEADKEAYVFATVPVTVPHPLFQSIRDAVEAQRLTNSMRWVPYQHDGQTYLTRILRRGALYFGAILKADYCIPEAAHNEAYTLLSTDGYTLLTHGPTLSGACDVSAILSHSQDVEIDGQRYHLIGVRSQSSDYILASFVPVSADIMQLSLLQWLAIAVTLIFILLILFQHRFQRAQIVAPLSVAVKAMENVGKGDIDTLIKDDPTALSEFRQVYHTFNHMVCQIKSLTTDVYEEKLKRQSADLQFLQIQNKPHFFANALQIIKALVEMGRYDEIIVVIDEIVQYMRYALSDSIDVVTLKDECEHAENYLQLARYSKKTQSLVFRKEIEPHLLHLVVPPLLIQTFLENAINHARIGEEVLTFALSCHTQERDGKLRLIIEMTDNGHGFPPEIIEMFDRDGHITGDPGSHIGLRNITARLQLLFHEDATIHLSNPDKGTLIVIDIPAIEDIDYDHPFVG